MLIAVFSLAALGLLLGGGLSFVNHLMAVDSDPLADELEAILPHLQCGQCKFPGCRPAAEALSAGEAPVTLCPPGGVAVAAKLAEKLQVDVNLDDLDQEPVVAFIIEERCIGCTKCILVCPTDCIIGAPKHLHTVIADACIGCDDCVEVCPTGCIEMVKLPSIEPTIDKWNWSKPVSPQTAADSRSVTL